ncbi:MAG: RagB/SusD family nutrient uptake outer membrane protein [Chitinophagaceae bacterium]
MSHKFFKIVVVALLFLTGCTKGLDLIPKDSISDATFWKSEADFKLAANNLYQSLESFNTYDVQTDLAYDVPNAISNGSFQATENDSRWTNAYIYIRRCNTILAKAETSPIASEVSRYVGEARFFRAYNYWLLFRLFGGVPLITRELAVDDEELYAARASRKETIDFILKELAEAAALLPARSELGSVDIGRITEGAANGLRARAALFEATWGQNRSDANANAYFDIAISAASAVMNSAEYALFTARGAQSYRYFFIEEGDDGSEAILDRRYQMQIASYNMPGVVGEGRMIPTKKLADMYLCKDGLPVTQSPLFQGYNQFTSEFQDRDPRMSMSLVVPGTEIPQCWYPQPAEAWPFYPQRNANTGYTTYKFLSENAASNESPGLGYGFDCHLIRYAEILLIYAEAVYEKNGDISDADLGKLINLLRQRVNMPFLTNSFVGANGLNMRTEIRRERTIELAFEGFRYDDLRRWKTAETELPMDIKGAKIKGTPWASPIIVEGQDRNPYSNASWQNRTDANGFLIVEGAAGRVFNASKHYLMPLPTREILINPALQQNPNW